MPRAKQFDPDKLLETAMLMFWSKGYEATSIRDIVERSGVNQFSIYSLYSDKHGLFLAVLDKYRDEIVGTVFGVIEAPGASMPEIRRYFELLVDYHTSSMRAMGCLMANTMSEKSLDDPGILVRTRSHIDRQRAGFTAALARAVERGEARADLDIPAAAEFLVVSVQGLSVYSRVNPDRAALAQYIETVLSSLTPAKK